MERMCDGAYLYLLARVEDETLKKVVLHSVATALASMVLPVPGGPNMSTPCRQPPIAFSRHTASHTHRQMDRRTATLRLLALSTDYGLPHVTDR